MSTTTPSVGTANPRKFAEKIALHTQKGAEETAEFTKIMAECAAVYATRVPHAYSLLGPMLFIIFKYFRRKNRQKISDSDSTFMTTIYRDIGFPENRQHFRGK
jgi:hypothetical protein